MIPAEETGPQYILRPGYRIVADPDRLAALLDWAVSAKVDAVMAFNNIAADTGNHPSVARQQEAVAALAEAFALVRARGLDPQVNFFNTLGHRPVPPAEDGPQFTWLVDDFGEEIVGCACPADPAFVAHIAAAYARVAAITDAVWIDDDFRLSWVPPKHRSMCFCQRHLSLFHTAGGTIDGNELGELLRRDPAECSQDEIDERALWKRVQAGILVDLLRAVHDAAVAVNPQIRFGLMFTEIGPMLGHGRDLDAELAALTTEGGPVPWTRFASGNRTDANPFGYLRSAIRFDLAQARLRAPHRVGVEVENFPWAVGQKSVQGLKLELILDTATVGGDITLSVNDSRFGLEDTTGNLGAALAAVKPVLTELQQSARGHHRAGVSIPVPSDPTRAGAISATGPGLDWNLSLAQIGIAINPHQPAVRVVGLADAVVADDTELARWAASGLLLTAEALHHLQGRGLLTDLGVTTAPADRTTGSEVVTSSAAPDWMRGIPAVAGHYFPSGGRRIVVDDPVVEILAGHGTTTSQAMTDPSVVLVRDRRIGIVTHTGANLRETAHAWLHQRLLRDLAPEGRFPMVDTVTGVHPISWNGPDDDIWVLSNLTLEQWPTLTIDPGAGPVPARIELLDDNADWIDAPWEHDDRGRIILTDTPGPMAARIYRITHLNPKE